MFAQKFFSLLFDLLTTATYGAYVVETIETNAGFDSDVVKRLSLPRACQWIQIFNQLWKMLFIAWNIKTVFILKYICN